MITILFGWVRAVLCLTPNHGWVRAVVCLTPSTGAVAPLD